MFCSVLHTLKSPQNVGTIVRTHVAYGGGPIVFVGHRRPWDFKKGTHAFSRKLEKQCELVFLETDDMFFAWCKDKEYSTVAIEISKNAVSLPTFSFPTRTALIVGNEGAGLSQNFIDRCDSVVSIPQFDGGVECLNVGVSCSIAIYEMSRLRKDISKINGGKYTVVS